MAEPSGPPVAVLARQSQGEGSLDPLVHASAQLPDDVHLRIEADRDEIAKLRLIAAAYGRSEPQLQLSSEPQNGSASIAVTPIPASHPARAEGVRAVARSAFRIATGPGRERLVATSAELVEALSPGGRAPVRSGSDELLAGHRFGVITNIPNHYRVPLWNQVRTRLTAAGADFRVFFAAGGTAPERPWLRHQSIEFEHRLLRPRRRSGFLPPLDLVAELKDYRPTVLVSGGFSPSTTGRALAYARANEIAFGIWSGDTALQAAQRGVIRRTQRRWIAQRCDFGMAYGSLAAEYLQALAAALPTVIVRNTAPFPARRAQAPPGDAIEILTVGRANPGKGLEILIEAFGLIPGLGCRLTVVGGGPKLDELRRRARGLANVRFLGAVGSDRVLDAYGGSDVFVFPTGSDVFGLVLVEAMGAGLPTITSPFAGAAADLCVDDTTGLVLMRNEPRDWATAIQRLVADDEARARLGAAASQLIRDRWTVEHSVDAWVAGLRLGASRTASSAPA